MAKGKKKTKFIPLDQIGKLESKKTEEKVNSSENKVENSSTPETKEKPTSPKDTTPKSNNNNKKEKKEKVIKDEKEDFSTCIICTEDVKLYAVGVCNHPICHKCSLRLRVLYQSKECPYCKTALEDVIYTKNDKKPFEEYNLSEFVCRNKDKGSYYDSEDIKKIVESMEKYRCPDNDCAFVGDDWMSLKKHAKDVHNKFFCNICINKKKVFPYEQKLYTQNELNMHNEKGDPDDKSFKGHPQCGFCVQRFYDDDDLYDHCKKNHEECQCCKQLGKPNQYFVNYRTLAEHFDREHFVCPHPECLEKKFIVFASEFELKAHEIEEHLNTPGKGKGRYQPIDLGFQYTDSHASSSNYRSRNDRGDRNDRHNNRNDRYNNRNDNRNNRNNRNERNDRNDRNDGNERRERNNRNNRNNRNERNNEDTTASSTIPNNNNNETSGNEESSQRSNQRSNNRSKKNNNRGSARSRFNVPEGFGSKLTGSENEAKPEEETVQESSSSSQNNTNQPRQSPQPATLSSSHSATTTITSMDPEEIELIKKLNKMIGTDQNQVNTFKTISSSYYNNLLPAESFLEAFIALVNKNDVKGKGKKKNVNDKIGGVWNQMAKNLLKKKDTPEGEKIDFEKKCNDMLRAWNDYKVKQNDQEEDYSTILAEKKKNMTNSYASHADMPDSLGLLKPRQKAKVLVIKSSKNSSPVASRNHSSDNVSSSFYDRIAEKMIQRDKKEKEKEKTRFVVDTESSNNDTSESESEEEIATTTNVAATSNTTTTTSTTTTQEKNATPINTPTSQTVVANAVKYLNSSKHRMNKYNSDFPSLSGSSTSAAAYLASSSNNNNNNNPYDRSSQKNKFKPMSQKLKSQEEFPSLQSTNNRKKNNQIKQPRSKSTVLRIV